MLYLRDIEQRKPAIIDTATAAIGLATLVLLAAWLRSPWAFVINQIWAVALRSAAYHFAHPVRTHFTLRWGPLRRFVRFGVGYNMAATSSYLIDSVDRLIIGRSLGMHSLGVYDRASTMAHYGVRQLPSLLTGSLLYPAFSRVRHDLARFWRLARRILGGLALVGTAGAAAMWLVAEPLLALVAGEGHEVYVEPFRILLVVALCRGIATLGHVPFYALGRPQLQTIANLAQVAVIAVGLPIAFARGGSLDAACQVAVAAGAANLGVTLLLLVGLARAGAATTSPPTPQPSEPETERVA
jgi:O-antigen/teichoic acid export membrane protein